MSTPAERKRALHACEVGYGLSLALTAAAFAAVRWPRASPATVLAIVCALGLAQMVVQCRFFLRLGLRPGARDILQLVVFSALIVGLMVAGTLVVLVNLRARMM